MPIAIPKEVEGYEEIIEDKVRQAYNPTPDEKGKLIIGELLLIKGVLFEVCELNNRKLVLVSVDEAG